jgi:hypothetical protein
LQLVAEIGTFTDVRFLLTSGGRSGHQVIRSCLVEADRRLDRDGFPQA